MLGVFRRTSIFAASLSDFTRPRLFGRRPPSAARLLASLLSLGVVLALVQDAEGTEFLKRQETVGVFGYLWLAQARIVDDKCVGGATKPVRVCDLNPGAEG